MDIMTSLTTQNSLLLNNLMKFYNSNNNLDKILNINLEKIFFLRNHGPRSRIRL